MKEDRAAEDGESVGGMSPGPGALSGRPENGDGVPSVSPESLQRTIESDLIPRLMMAHRAGSIPPELVSAAEAELSDADVEEFVRRVREGPGDRALDYVKALRHSGVEAEAVYLDLLAPAARRLGELWEQDECDFVRVTMALGRMQRILRKLTPCFHKSGDPSNCSGRALLTCVPGEEHSLGLLIVAEFFVREGWAVQVGAPFEADEILDMVAERPFDVVGFSVACDDNLHELSGHISRIRDRAVNDDLAVLVGGQAFRERPELSERVGADASAPDARAAVEVARALASQDAEGGRALRGC